jgi:hypothetical protein
MAPSMATTISTRIAKAGDSAEHRAGAACRTATLSTIA